MTPKEIVTRAIEFEKPERIPIRFPGFGFDDTYGVGYQPAGGWKPSKLNEDEWGCVWEKPQDVSPSSKIVNMGQVKGHPLKDLGMLRDFKFPDPQDSNRFVPMEGALKDAGDKYVILGDGFTLFERSWGLHGMTQLFIDMYEKPGLVHELLDRITEFHIGILESLKPFKGRIHGYSLGDDWGSEKATFISVPAFREFFKPRYKLMIDRIHALGMHAWLHSCGRINNFIEEFIDIGLDVINPQQPRALGIDEISRRYQGRICFETLADIQKVYPRASKEEIGQEIKLLIEKWGTPDGGFIGSDYTDHTAIGVSEENAGYLFEAFKKYGKY